VPRAVLPPWETDQPPWESVRPRWETERPSWESLEALAAPGPAPLPVPQPAARHQTPRSRPTLLVAMILVLVVTAGLGQALTRSTVLTPRRPALTAEAASTPLAVPEPAPAGRGGYRFLQEQDDGSHHPVRWDPCRPIHYVLRDASAPPGGDAAITSAIAEIERITGLRFVYDGTTDEVPRPDRPTMDPGRYGHRWSPLLIAWTDPQEYPGITGYAGLSGSDPVAGDRPGTLRYVTGLLLLNREHLEQVAGWQGGEARMRAVVLHELGHVVGLDHVSDPGELMYPRPTVLAFDFADGDRRGLAALSGGPCFRDF